MFLCRDILHLNRKGIDQPGRCQTSRTLSGWIHRMRLHHELLCYRYVQSTCLREQIIEVAVVLILWRIHVVHRASARYFSAASGSIIISGRLQWPQLSRILVESSLAYALSGIVVLIATFTGSNAIYPTSDFVRSILIPLSHTLTNPFNTAGCTTRWHTV